MEEKKNHGLPDKLENGYELSVWTYDDWYREGFTQDEVDEQFAAEPGTVAKTYSYDGEDGCGARIGVEFTDGRLAIYGCHADIDRCESEEQFVEELTDEYYN